MNMINSKKIIENKNLTEIEKKEFIEILENEKQIYYDNYYEEFLFRPTLHGDYTGSSVERANYETIQEKKSIHKNKNAQSPFILWKGDFSSHAIEILPENFHSSDLEFLKTIIDEIDNYPVLDDEKLSEIEYNLQKEAIEDFKKYNKHKYYFNENFFETAFDFLQECNCYAFFIDYAEDDLINHLEKNNAIFTPTKKIIDIIDNYEIDEKAILEKMNISEKSKDIVIELFSSKTAEKIGKLISDLNLPENEIQRIKENF